MPEPESLRDALPVGWSGGGGWSTYFFAFENASLAQDLPHQRPRNSNRMRHQNADLSQYARRFVEDAELAQYCPAVVVDFFSGQTVIGVEGVDTAKWEFHPSPSCRETAPGAELRSANHDFEDDCVVGDVAALDLDL